ncbi:MAG: hypothetical protein OXI22_08785 [Defluviicoccus sp.]|nr:hypothetical protein [Defluviicoccus sp.]MDE0383965.1 hypothetical protein [Defluviicoccus sp.]
MSTEIVMAFIALAGVGIANLAFVWRMMSSIGDLRERMARLEGLIEGFVRRNDPPGLPAAGE